MFVLETGLDTRRDTYTEESNSSAVDDILFTEWQSGFVDPYISALDQLEDFTRNLAFQHLTASGMERPPVMEWMPHLEL